MSRNFSDVPEHIILDDGRRVTVPTREEGFRIIRDPNHDAWLIIPSDRKRYWTIEERFFRSMLLSREGKVLSTGFPKFANLGEGGFEDHHEDLLQAFKLRRPITVTEKIDGTLIIRSVIEGRVHLRTRGSWSLGRFQAPVLEQFKKYPRLQDPTYRSGESLLFEFTSSSPKLRVVLAHRQDGLTLLASVSHSNLKRIDGNGLATISREVGVAMAPSVSLSGPLSTWKKEVGSWDGREGVVIGLASGALIKLKADSYLALHRLTTSFSVRQVKRLIIGRKLYDKAAFEKFLKKAGADWETVVSLEPLIDATSEAYRYSMETFPAIVDAVDLICMEVGGDRKKQVHQVNGRYGDNDERNVALLCLDGRENEAEGALQHLLIERALEQFEDSADEEYLEEG